MNEGDLSQQDWIPVFFEFGTWWWVSAAVLLCLGIYISICRQVLESFSRKALLARTPKQRHEELEKYLDREDLYAASFRSLDHFTRLVLILTLAVGRFVVLPPQNLEDQTNAMLSALVLVLEISLLFVVFLDVVPGIIARLRPESLFLRLIPSLDLLHRLIVPFRLTSEGIVGAVVKGLGGTSERTSADILEDEILSAAEEGEREGLLESRDIDMIESIIAFGGVEVGEVMTPRTDMVCLDVAAPFEENLKRAVKCGHSRIPVFQESKDSIVGILYVKDLLKDWGDKDSIQLQEVLREPHFVPLSKKIGDLLQEFKSQRFHIAIVLDEFGGTSGLITIEDLIEEIVGDITDEFEPVEQPLVRQIAPGVIEADAAVRVDELNEQAKIDLPEGDGYETIGGFLLSHMGRIPRTGETFDFDALKFEVTAAEERRIRRVRIQLPDGQAASRDNGKPDG